MSSFSGAPTRPRVGIQTLGAISLVLAAVIVFAGNYHVQPGENGGTGPGIATGIICLALAAGLFGFVVPRASNPDRTAFVLAVIGVVSVLAFWSGVTPVFALASLAASERADAGPARRTRIAQVLAGIATIAALVVTLSSSHL